MYSFENIIGERNLVLSPVINEKIRKTSVYGLYLSYMPTTLYFFYFHTNSIAMLYIVHKYTKKFGSTNMDLTHSKIMIFSSFSS